MVNYRFRILFGIYLRNPFFNIFEIRLKFFLLIVMVDPLQAVGFIVFIVILQQIEGNVIYPKVVGDSIGLPGIWVFAAIIVGGGLLGIAGILLGVPVAATIYKLLGKAVNRTSVETIVDTPPEHDL